MRRVTRRAKFWDTTGLWMVQIESIGTNLIDQRLASVY
jgi:hypothetical protein